MKTTKANGANGAKVNNVKNGANNNGAKLEINKKQAKTETEKAAEKAQRAKERAERMQAQKAATAEKHENAKSACSYNFYGVIMDARTATPFAACKHLFLDMQTAHGGAILHPLAHVIGNDKREFAEIYAERVKKAAKEKGVKKYTAFLVWRVVWEDLKKYTRGEMKTDAETLKAIETLRAAMEKRQAENKKAKAEKASAKAAAK